MLTPLSVRRELARQPLEVQRACTPLSIVRALYGLVPGETRCPSCGRVYELSRYPMNFCGCGRPYARRCTGVPKRDGSRVAGCGELVEPKPTGAENAGPGGWTEPDAACESCRTDADRRGRALTFERALPRNEGALAANAVMSYLATPARARFDALARQVIEHGAPSVLYVWGPPGTGKSTGVARLVHRLYVAKSAVRSFLWLAEDELLRLNSARYGRDEVAAERARDILESARTVELLVVDECWSHPLSESARAFLADVWRERLGRAGALKTIAISNLEQAFATLGLHIESRFLGVSETAYVGGAS